MLNKTKERLDGKILGLPDELFGLSIDKLRHGYYSDKYFQRAKIILEKDNYNSTVLMQVFTKKEAIVGGIDSAIAVLKECTGRYEDEKGNVVPLEEKLADQKGIWVNKFEKLEVKALYDGDYVKPSINSSGIEYKPVMTIKGDLSLFAHLESLYLGLLARGTRVSTNVKNVVNAAGEVPILFFPARFDHPAVQTADGYAAMKSGALGVSTDANAAWWGGEGFGTVPHALIAVYNGDTVLATRKFAEYIDPKINLVSLVDYENDCVNTALAVARSLKDKLWGVRLDTSENLVDVSLQDNDMLGQYKPNGVCIPLVYKVREALDKEGFDYVKIVVSGGFNVEKIKEFQKLGVPVGAYGVGSSLLEGKFDYTADVVQMEKNGKMVHNAKVGRKYVHNNRLEKVL